jgi:hypothetical protein
MSADLINKLNLQALPEELLQHIVEYLDPHGLSAFSLTAGWCYELAAAVTWREVVLTDCRREHKNGIDEDGREFDGIDDHDDTPLLKKLLVLARSVCDTWEKPCLSAISLIFQQESVNCKPCSNNDTSVSSASASDIQ